MANTILSFLASRLAEHPEYIATEGLGYLLTNSADCRAAVVSIARLAVANFTQDLRFRTQAGEADSGRPDVIGEDGNGATVVVLEAKFWAGLTDAQPTAYFGRFTSPGGVLLFVAPALRDRLLWQELKSRCRTAAIALGAESTAQAGVRWIPAGTHHLMQVSWAALLALMIAAAEGANDLKTASDARQLKGLCDQMDSEAFLPLRGEDLTGTLPRRVIQYGEIVDDLIVLFEGKRGAKTGRATAASGWYGKTLVADGHTFFLSFSCWHWVKYGETPIWLALKAPVDADRQVLRARGISFYDAVLDRVDWLVLPILLPAQVERETLIKAAIDQIELIVSVLPQGAPPQTPVNPTVAAT